jgi:hypothetical protein
MPVPVPCMTLTGSLQVTPPSVERLTDTSPCETLALPWPPVFSSWAISTTLCSRSKAGAGSPAPLPERMGICPSIQVRPPSNEVKNPVGTIAWRAPVELLKR